MKPKTGTAQGAPALVDERAEKLLSELRGADWCFGQAVDQNRSLVLMLKAVIWALPEEQVEMRQNLLAISRRVEADLAWLNNVKSAIEGVIVAGEGPAVTSAPGDAPTMVVH